MSKVRNSYTLVHLKILFNIVRKGKLSVRKIFNWLGCQIAFWQKSSKSSVFPYMLSLELWNECNADCVFCRNEKGVIYDQDPSSKTGYVEKGRMPLEMATEIIDQLKNHLLIAVLYTNGEPLMYKDLSKVIRFATERKVATMISSNGILLDEKKSRTILDAGLDFIKIQLSGFTQDIYSVQIRKGNVETLKENIIRFTKMNKDGKYGTVILIDYIYYQYNKHQLPLLQEFCANLDGVILNVRPGNPSHGLEKTEPPLNTESLPLKGGCDWLYKGMQVNYNGDVLQCCEGVVWGKSEVYERFDVTQSRLDKIWNGPNACRMRQRINEKGRGDIPICSQCTRKGITFKW